MQRFILRCLSLSISLDSTTDSPKYPVAACYGVNLRAILIRITWYAAAFIIQLSVIWLYKLHYCRQNRNKSHWLMELFMQYIFWGVGIFGLIGFAAFASIFIRMINIGEITDLKRSLIKQEYVILRDGITVADISVDESPLSWEAYMAKGDSQPALEALLEEDGTFTPGKAYFSEQLDRRYELLISPNNHYSFAIKGPNFYKLSNNKLGAKLPDISNPQVADARFTMPIDDTMFLMVSDRVETEYADTWLWQVNADTFEKELLSDDPYYEFERSPLVFMPEGLDGKVVIYFTGDYSWGYGGQSRPKNSVIRLYNNDNPSGVDLVKFDFASGTILDLKFENNALLLMGDPRTPRSGNPRLPPLRWRVDLGSANQGSGD